MTILLSVLYVLSFGPACWIVSRQGSGEGRIPRIYWPIGWASARWPEWIGRPIVWYAELGMPKGGIVSIPFDPAEAEFIGSWMPVVRE